LSIAVLTVYSIVDAFLALSSRECQIELWIE